MSTRKLRPKQLLAASLTAIVLATTACSSKPPSSTGQRTPRITDKVTYLTGFGSFGREGYAWVAKDKGFFADAGIDVTIQPGAAGDSNLALLAANKAQFAVIDYAGAVVRAGTGKFGDFTVIAAITQQTLIAIMVLAGHGITAPSDLAGKTLAQGTGAVPKTLFKAYARKAGFDPATVRWRDVPPPQLPALLVSGKVDGIGQFVVGQPAIQHAAGNRLVRVFPYSDQITDLYGNVLVTSTALLATDPDLAHRFTAALLKGLRYSIEHPQEAGDILHKAVPATDAATATGELNLLKEYVGTAQVPLGGLNPNRVARGVATIQSLGLIPGPVEPTSFVDFTVAPTPAAPTSSR